MPKGFRRELRELLSAFAATLRAMMLSLLLLTAACGYEIPANKEGLLHTQQLVGFITQEVATMNAQFPVLASEMGLARASGDQETATKLHSQLSKMAKKYCETRKEVSGLLERIRSIYQGVQKEDKSLLEDGLPTDKPLGFRKGLKGQKEAVEGPCCKASYEEWQRLHRGGDLRTGGRQQLGQPDGPSEDGPGGAHHRKAVRQQGLWTRGAL